MSSRRAGAPAELRKVYDEVDELLLSDIYPNMGTSEGLPSLMGKLGDLNQRYGRLVQLFATYNRLVRVTNQQVAQERKVLERKIVLIGTRNAKGWEDKSVSWGPNLSARTSLGYAALSKEDEELARKEVLVEELKAVRDKIDYARRKLDVELALLQSEVEIAKRLYDHS